MLKIGKLCMSKPLTTAIQIFFYYALRFVKLPIQLLLVLILCGVCVMLIRDFPPP